MTGNLIQRMKTGRSDADVKTALDDNALEQVAGGGEDPRCSDTFSRGEWCWFADSCSYIITGYGDDAAPVNIPDNGPEMAAGNEETPLIEDKFLETYKRCGNSAYGDLIDAYTEAGLLTDNDCHITY